jgi:nicotinic acid phosphoribosyltransferase
MTNTSDLEKITRQDKILHEETDLYNITMDVLGPDETDTGYSVWQAIPRDVNKYFQPRVMAGGRAIMREYNKHYANAGLEFCVLQDGMPFLPGDPVIQVIGDKSTARKLEPKVLSTLFYMTEIATRTKELIDEFGADRIIEVGMRAEAPGAWTYGAEAFLIGGGKLTSNTALKNVEGLVEGKDYVLVGTTGHSLYLEYMAAGYTQKEAFKEILQKFEKNYPGKACSILVDTVEPMLGIDQALECIKERKKISGQTHNIRLDSGDLLNQTLYALREMVPIINDFKVIIEDGLTVEKVRKYEAAIRNAGFDPKKHIIYGLGGFFFNNITRDDNGAWAYKPSVFRTKNNGDVNVIKLSGNPLKQSLPGLIGINYNIFANRLDVHAKHCANKIFTYENQDEYFAKNVAQLIAEAKPYWDQMKGIPRKWFETYNMSDTLAKMQHDAVKRTHDFGYKTAVVQITQTA